MTLRRKLVLATTSAVWSINSLTDPFVKDLFEALNFRLPSRPTITEDIIDVAVETEENVNCAIRDSDWVGSLIS